MNWKERISKMVLRQIKGENRERKGCRLSNAHSIGLLYLERDHAHYRFVKDLAKYLHEEVGVKKISMLSYVNNDKKHIDSTTLFKGDIILLCAGGHGFEILENAVMIEIKQGPYNSINDKVRFKGIEK